MSFVLFFYYLQATLMVTAIGAKAGERAVNTIKESQFSTVIPVDGEPYKGKLIVCSERFCGFHNGREPKIMASDGVKEIVPPLDTKRHD